MPKTIQQKVEKTTPKIKKVEKISPKAINSQKIKKPINVPVMRCVGQLKSHLNDETKNKITDILENNKAYETRITEFNTQIKDAKVFSDKEKTLADAEGTAEAKNVLRKQLVDFKEKNKDVTDSITKLNKSIYRISGPASKYLSSILHTIIYNILDHSVDSTLKKSLPAQKQPKVDRLSFGDISRENFDFYPIITDLPTFVEVQTLFRKREFEEKEEKEKKEKKEKKPRKKTSEVPEPTLDEDEAEEDEKPEPDTTNDSDDEKKPTTYKMVIYNIFRMIVKNRDLEEGKKLCCAVPTREVISNILLEYVERLSNFLEILVGATANANTINEDHIMNANKLMFTMFNSTDKYGKFEDQVKQTYKVIEEVRCDTQKETTTM
tara:strand:+ start:7887 stop:9023 length:1137 start_codon:yes stop_codon:yes gene_type:complete